MSVEPVRRPRVLIVSATYASAENRKKLTALAEHVEVICLTCRSARAFGVEFVADEADMTPGCRVVALPHSGNPASSTRFILRGLAHALREAAPDVVIVEQEPWALVRWQAWLAARFAPSAPAFGEFSWENFERPGWKGRLLGIVYRLAVASTRFVIAGNRLGGELWRRYGLPEARLLVCPQMGIDAKRFAPCSLEEKRRLRREWQLPEDAFLVGFAGRLTECKGVDQLANSFAELKAAGKLDGACLCLLGGGNLKPGLEQMAADASWLRLLPPVDHGRVADFLKCLDLFVHASRPAVNARGEVTFLEQSPYALGQAMLTGLPCIAGATGAIVDLMEGLEGLIAPGDQPALSRELQQCFASSPRSQAARGMANRARVQERWTNEVIAARWAEIITRALHAASPRCAS